MGNLPLVHISLNLTPIKSINFCEELSHFALEFEMGVGGGWKPLIKYTHLTSLFLISFSDAALKT